MFVEPNKFSFVSLLESNWQIICEELKALSKHNFIPWMEKDIYDSGWDVFGLYAFGQKIEKNCQICPQTTQLIEMIPGMTTAGFSALQAGTHIKPHTGYTDAVLRCHLGLIIPDDRCGIRVGSDRRHWQQGKCVVFDDTLEHEAWNESNRPRIILLIDFLKN
jgi:ornithine lipid ester-linked acyl 2-hydroxylase